MPKETPKRAAYKAAEVCEIAHIQPYVLRSWESEFPRLGVVRGGVRVYRQADLEQVLRIKELVFDHGLTLGGARRRLEEEQQPQPDLPLDEFVTPEVRQRVAQVRQGLEDLLTMLGGGRAPRADGVGGCLEPSDPRSVRLALVEGRTEGGAEERSSSPVPGGAVRAASKTAPHPKGPARKGSASRAKGARRPHRAV